MVAGDHSLAKDDGTEQTVTVAQFKIHQNYESPKRFQLYEIWIQWIT